MVMNSKPRPSLAGILHCGGGWLYGSTGRRLSHLELTKMPLVLAE